MRKWNFVGGVERQHSDRPPVGRDQKVLPDLGIISTSTVVGWGRGHRGGGGGFNSHPPARLLRLDSRARSEGAAKKHAERQVFDRRVKNYQLKVHPPLPFSSGASWEMALFKVQPPFLVHVSLLNHAGMDCECQTERNRK